MTTDTVSENRTVHSRVKKTSDIEIHVSTIVAPNGGQYVDIREFVVSLQQYGRGITFPADTEILDSVHDGLNGAYGLETPL